MFTLIKKNVKMSSPQDQASNFIVNNAYFGKT